MFDLDSMFDLGSDCWRLRAYDALVYTPASLATLKGEIGVFSGRQQPRNLLAQLAKAATHIVRTPLVGCGAFPEC